MKIVKLKAGLGNQMFQYAFMRLLQVKYGIKDVRLDVSYFDSPNFRKYLESGIDLLNVEYKIAAREDLRQFHIPYNNRTPHTFSHRLVSASQALFNSRYYYEKNRDYVNVESILKYSYFDGYWQSWRYLEPIRDLILEEFKPKAGLSEKTNKYIEKFSALNYVFIGVRKGDYTESSKSTNHYGAPSLDYYKKAVPLVLERVKDPYFVIFSDDIEWVRNNIDFNEAGISDNQIEFRTEDRIVSNFEEMYVMASCKHAIISNSTFNFWGAWMIDNPDKVIVAPKNWFKDGKPIDIIPPEWIQV